MSDGQHKVYAGQITLGVTADDEPDTRYGEVWVSGAKAVFFESGTGELVELDSMTMANGPDGRLEFTGTTHDEPATWTALLPERATRSFTRAKVTFTDATWEQTTVRESNYRVRVMLAGEPERSYPGARLRQLNTRQVQILLIDGTVVPVQLSGKRGCGCASK